MNIQKAILEEQAYLQDSKNGINTSLKQRLQPYGYNDLETFFNEKALYQIRQLNLPVFYDDDIPHIRENWMQKVIDKIPCIYLPRPSKTWAWLGANKLDRVDQEGLLSEGIEIANMGWPGGTIISGKDDLQISVILPRELNVNSKLFQQKYAELVNWAQTKGIKQSGVDKFISADKADIYFVAFASLAPEDYTIVTEEKSAINSKSDIKLPDACSAFNVRSINFIQMLRELKVQF